MSLLTDVQDKLESAGIVEDITLLGISPEEANTLSLPDIVRRMNQAKGIVASYIEAKEQETLGLNGVTTTQVNATNRFSTDNGVVDVEDASSGSEEVAADNTDTSPKKKSKAAPVVPLTPATDTPSAASGVIPVVPQGETV